LTKDKPLPEGFVINEKIAERVKSHLSDEQLSCTAAHRIAAQFKVTPAFIGHIVDAIDIRLYKCQLGLYGYPNKRGWADAGVTEMAIPEEFTRAIRDETNEDNEITCAQLWKLAAEYGISRMQAGYIVDTLGTRIIKCQLGAF
jgi:hypothetical protein